MSPSQIGSLFAPTPGGGVKIIEYQINEINAIAHCSRLEIDAGHPLYRRRSILLVRSPVTTA